MGLGQTLPTFLIQALTPQKNDRNADIDLTLTADQISWIGSSHINFFFVLPKFFKF